MREQAIQSAERLDADESTSEGGRGEIDFAAQFQRSFRVLWLIAAGMLGKRDLAEDAIQEAALIALQKFDQFKPGTNFTAWMGQMVRHVALNTARKEQRRKAGNLDQDVSDARSPLARADRPEQLPLGGRGELPADQAHFDDELMEALNSVSDVARSCLLLKIVEGLDYAEISRIMQIPEGTAMSHVHRSRRHLRARLYGLWNNRATETGDGK